MALAEREPWMEDRAAQAFKDMSDAWNKFFRNRLALVGSIVIALIVLAGWGAPWLAPYDSHGQFFDGLTLEGAPLPPNGTFWFGTDLLGRDLLSRLLYGARTSLIIGVVANGAAVLIGTLLGLVAGFVRGWLG